MSNESDILALKTRIAALEGRYALIDQRIAAVEATTTMLIGDYSAVKAITDQQAIRLMRLETAVNLAPIGTVHNGIVVTFVPTCTLNGTVGEFTPSDGCRVISGILSYRPISDHGTISFDVRVDSTSVMSIAAVVPGYAISWSHSPAITVPANSPYRIILTQDRLMENLLAVFHVESL